MALSLYGIGTVYCISGKFTDIYKSDFVGV
jgi:hypothetical protein